MPEEQKEKLELLKREEVRTLEKDVAKLREREARMERAKISQIKEAPSPANGQESPSLVMQKDEAAMDQEPNLALPKPPSRTQKIALRVLLGAIAFLALLNIGLFVYTRVTS